MPSQFSIFLIVIIFLLQSSFLFKGISARFKLKKLLNELMNSNNIIEEFELLINQKGLITLTPVTFLDKNDIILTCRYNISIINNISNILIQLGLLGTFIGLTTMIIIMLQTSGAEEADIIGSISSGGISFITSLFGLTFSMILRWGFNKKVNLYYKLEKKLLYNFETKIAEKKKTNMVEDNKEILTELSSQITLPIHELIASVNNYSSSIDNHIENVNSSVPKIINNLQLEIEKATAIGLDAYSKFSEEVKTVNESFRSISSSIFSSSAQVGEALNSLNTIAINLNLFSESLHKSVNIHIAERESFDSSIELFNGEIENLHESYKEMTITNKETNDKTFEMLDNLGAVFEVVNQVTLELKKLPGELKQNLSNETQSELKKAVKDFGGEILGITKILHTIENNFKENIKGITEQITYVLNPTISEEKLINYKNDIGQIANSLTKISQQMIKGNHKDSKLEVLKVKGEPNG